MQHDRRAGAGVTISLPSFKSLGDTHPFLLSIIASSCYFFEYEKSNRAVTINMMMLSTSPKDDFWG